MKILPSFCFKISDFKITSCKGTAMRKCIRQEWKLVAKMENLEIIDECRILRQANCRLDHIPVVGRARKVMVEINKLQTCISAGEKIKRGDVCMNGFCTSISILLNGVIVAVHSMSVLGIQERLLSTQIFRLL